MDWHNVLQFNLQHVNIVRFLKPYGYVLTNFNRQGCIGLIFLLHQFSFILQPCHFLAATLGKSAHMPVCVVSLAHLCIYGVVHIYIATRDQKSELFSSTWNLSTKNNKSALPHYTYDVCILRLCMKLYTWKVCFYTETLSIKLCTWEVCFYTETVY